ncbi:52a08801-24a6-4730-9c94-5ac3205a5055 [Sclerotinia trifoliorum]|uniref:(4-O-methyl)-D-glucuronate--lignin esterase n=1 Tax=Sclerotinia trifoliorum TaxID=28548 RepID=A0A8H2ZJZ4_9HELO|nr:52a08801-24a6-4730-9c94-5ac3205a5055 [Sclerotinia trifoliorum]
MFKMLSISPIKLTLLFLTTSLLQTATSTALPRQATCGTLPSPIPTPSISYLPDPFTNLAGQRITTTDQWTCRKNELSLLFQNLELGILPPKPSSVTSSISGNTLSITCSESGKSISFSVSITYPSTGTAPYPAIIAYGGGSIPSPAGVAIINYNNDQIAQQNDQSSRGKGLFYNLYGSTHSAGAMIAWAWGVDRILDALEQTPNTKINPTSIGVTGCSRNGKGALIAGAFCPRIALTIPQESGSGGDASWRISDSIGSSTQTASEIVGENVWFSTSFNTWANRIPTLPFDHHELAALVSPRPLLAIENTDYVWLGPLSSYGAMTAAKYIYQAVGASANFGFSQVGGHSHCVFPSSQQADLDAFVNRFLKNGTGNTEIFRSTGNLAFNENQWVPWKGNVPVLSEGSGEFVTSTASTTAVLAPTVTSSVATTTAIDVPVPTANCQARWAQCGGIGYTGATCCVSGTTCTASNVYYLQCL